MRKLILQEHVTIDNFAADLNGGMDFQEKYSAKKDERFIKNAEAFLDTIDTMLVGATTYHFLQTTCQSLKNKRTHLQTK